MSIDKKTAKRVTAMFADLKAYRKARKLNQKDFWGAFGTTQSGGSRYEAGRDLPSAVKMLMALREAGKVSDEDLQAAAEVSGVDVLNPVAE